MLQLYLKLHLRSCVRILAEIGILRCIILVLISTLAIIVLAKVENQWLLPATCIVLLGSYHNRRKDKTFLLLQIKNIIRFYQKEYLVLSSPFIIAELAKGQWIIAIGLSIFSLLLPYLKEIRIKQTPIKLPFLYQGGMEYIRMFRQIGWVYLLLLLCSIIGAIHGNIRIAKISLIIWYFAQASVHFTIPDILQIHHFKSYRIFRNMLWKINGWNTVVTGIPFIGTILINSLSVDSTLFCLSSLLACILYLQNLGLLRQICSTSFSLFLIQLPVLLPLFFFSCFIPYLLVPFAAITGAVSFIVHNKLKQLWN